MQTPIYAFAKCKHKLPMTEHRYILEPYKGMNTRYGCPSCQQKDKTFSLYIDAETGEHIHPTVGRCNRESNCGHHYTPKQYFQVNNISFDTPQPKTNKPKPQQKTHLIFSHNMQGQPIDCNELFFTEISVYDSTKEGVLKHCSLNNLEKRLNNYKSDGNKKDQSPAFLKGIYNNGTAGDFCEKTSPFLFFDIDVKENENNLLLDAVANNLVYEYLEKVCVLIWRSNSQKGIAGIIYTPQFIGITKEQTGHHLEIAKKIYLYLSNLIEQNTGLMIDFDLQQGKFRQIRYLAEQTDTRKINHTPLLFNIVEQPPQQKPVSFIPIEVFKASLKAHETNHFVQFLFNLFGVEVANQLVSRYFIATSKHWNGATVFWQIDTQGKVRTGKIMLYSPTTGKRVKNLELPLYWVHKALNQPEFELRQCLFGEHLLIDKTKPVAIVESEKTAVIASIYLPQFIWVAVGSLNNLNAKKCSALKGRKVTLFPDLNGFNKWSSRAKELSQLAIFTVSDLLERKATEAEKKQGFDLADYLIKYDYKAFAIPEPPPTVQPLVEKKPFEQPVYYSRKPEQPKPESWNNDITELENYFSNIEIPTQPVKLNSCSTIKDCSLFIESQFSTVKANNGNSTFLPYLNRLQELKRVLTTDHLLFGK